MSTRVLPFPQTLLVTDTKIHKVSRYTNTDLKLSLYVNVHIKIKP